MRLPPPVLALSIVALVGCAATAPGEDSAADLLTRAAAIHARALVLDTHVDISGESYATAESVSHQARSWMTRGELELLRKNEAEAARLYRDAAVALQPVDL